MVRERVSGHPVGYIEGTQTLLFLGRIDEAEALISDARVRFPDNQDVAIAWARMADRLEPEKLADLFDHFEHYCEVLGLNKRAKSVMRMDLNDDGKGEDDGETDVDGKIVRGAFPSPGGVAAE